MSAIGTLLNRNINQMVDYMKQVLQLVSGAGYVRFDNYNKSFVIDFERRKKASLSISN